MARSFNGSSDRIDYTNLRDWSTTAQSWSWWALWDGAGVGHSQYVFNDHASGDGSNALLVFNNSGTSDIQITVITDGTTMVGRTASSVLTTGAWQHVALTWDGTIGDPATKMVFYFDGSPFTPNFNVTGTGTAIAATGSLSLGGRIFDDTRNFDGILAEMARWSRVLTAAEIAGLAKGYSAKHYARDLEVYCPLVRAQHDVSGGRAGTLDGTSEAAHPRIILPRRFRGK